MKARIALMVAGVLGTVAGGVAYAAPDACGGLDFKDGKLVTGKPMTQEWLASDEGHACLALVAKQVQSRRLIRSVTVAVRVPDAQRAEGKALPLARKIADELVAAGIPKKRCFAVAPRAEAQDTMTIQIGYTERAPEQFVAKLNTVDGDVTVGESETELQKAEAGAPVIANELIRTGAKSQASVKLADGSVIKLGPDGLIRFKLIEISDTMQRKVEVELIRGDVNSDVQKAAEGSRFQVSSKSAVAAVRGTQFRMLLPEDGAARLETLEGKVAFGNKTGELVDVPAGQGAKVTADGKVVPPRALPKAPKVVGPLRGPLAAGAGLSWEKVEGAVSYRVDVARDADFLVSRETLVSHSTEQALAQKRASGKWFWQVTAVDDAGFVGMPSKVFSFEAP